MIQKKNAKKDGLAGNIITVSLLITIGLVAGRSYTAATLVLCTIVFLISIREPVYGIVLVIAFYTCDQLMIGQGTGSLAPGRYLLILNILVCIRSFFKNRGKMKMIPQFYFYYVIVFLGVLTLLWAPNKEQGAVYLLKLTILVVWARMVFPFLTRKQILENLSFLMCMTTGFVAFILLFGGVSMTSHSDHRIIMAGLGINAIAISFGFVIVFSSLCLTGRAGSLKKVIVIAFNLLIYTAILKMGTRSVALGIPLSILLGMCVTNARFFVRYAAIVFAVAALIGSCIYVAIDNKMITGKLAERFTGLTKLNTYTENSRIQLAKYSLIHVMRYPFGTGAGNEQIFFGNFNYKVDLFESHNTFISTMVQFGIIGFFLLAAAWILLLIRVLLIKDVKYRYLSMVTVTYLIFQLMKGSMLQTRLYWIPLILVFALIEMAGTVKKDGQSHLPVGITAYVPGP